MPAKKPAAKKPVAKKPSINTKIKQEIIFRDKYETDRNYKLRVDNFLSLMKSKKLLEKYGTVKVKNLKINLLVMDEIKKDLPEATLSQMARLVQYFKDYKSL